MVSSESFHTQVQPRVLDIEVTNVTRGLPHIEPKWSGVVGGVPIALIPQKERGGFRLDLEIKW